MTIRATRLIPTLIESLYMPFRSLFSLVALGPLTALFISGCQTAAPLPPASFVQVLCINGRCGVVDQDGKQRVPFENGYRALFLSPDGRTALVSNGAGWELFDVASQSVTRKLPIDGDVKALDDRDDSGERMDLVAFQRGGKWGLMDFEGKERQAPQFDDVSMLGLGHSTIAYAIGDRWGLLNAKGQRVTEAVYLDYPLIMVSDDAGKETGLILASTGGQSWLIQLQDGQRHPVAFSDVNYVGDGHWEVSHGDGENRRAGLMDATGRLVIDMKYRWLGNSGNGLIAFPTKGGELCGYLDYQGQTVIAPQFSSCGPFGKRGALAAEANSGEWGFIDRHGDWREPPSYDFGGDSLTFSTVSSVADDTMQNVSIRSTEEAMVRSTSQGLRTVAKFIGGEASTKQRDALGRYMGRGDYSYGPVIDHDPNGLVVADVRSGIFDTDRGREVIPPTYRAINVLTHDRFVFADKPDPSLPNHAHLGVIDASAKVLIPPGEFYGFCANRSAHYLLAERYADETQSLYDIDGHLVVDTPYKILSIDESRGIVRGYVRSDELGGIYNLRGHQVLSVVTMSCGAKQLRNGADQPIWPINVESYCTD